MVSRFRTKQEIKETLESLAAGRLDVIVGTHRLLSKDVALQGSRPAGRRRRAALRRGAQGAHQADAQEGRRPDHDGDADSAHAEHVARRHPRHVGDRDAAEGSARDSDQRREVRLRRCSCARFAPRSRAAARCSSSTTASSRSISMGNLLQRLVPDARVVIGHGQMARGRAREGDARLHDAQGRRPAGDDHRRERPRYSERQHDHHQSRRSLRPGAALSAARPRRPQRSRGVRVPADSAGRIAVAGGAQAAVGDEGVQRPRQRLPRRGTRPRNPRRRQSARRRAERHYRCGRLRDVHEAARRNDPRAEGRGSRRRRARDRESAGSTSASTRATCRT